MAAHETLATRIDVRPYAWGSGAEARSALDGPFDIVIGADITYDARAMVHLKEDIHSLTEPEAGRLILAFARRCDAHNADKAQLWLKPATSYSHTPVCGADTSMCDNRLKLGC